MWLTGVATAGPSVDPKGKNACGHHLEVLVVDSRNVPIPGARVQFAWVTPPGGSLMIVGDGRLEKIEYRTPFDEQFADAHGVAICEECCTAEGSHEVVADSPGFATGTVHGLGLDSVVVLRLVTGATVRGRVTRDGKPVAGARITMVGGPEIETEPDGSYEYVNLVPQSSYVFYTPMDHGKSAGATRSCYVVTGRTGTTTVAPDFLVRPVHTLRGVLVSPPGVSFPERTLLFWSRTIKSQRGRDDYYERPYLYVSPDGRFEITGLPEQTVRLEFTYPGWEFSPHSPPPFLRSPDGAWLTWDVRSDLDGVRIPLALTPPRSAPARETEHSVP